MDEEGENIIGLIPELEENFKRLGLTMMKDSDTFKTTYDIMDELAQQWEHLTDVQRAQMTELLAGKRQGSIVASMLENWSDAVGSYETALNSAGSAQREFEVFQESYEYKIGRLKASMGEFWHTFYDHYAVKALIDGLSASIELLTKFTEMGGMLPMISTMFLTLAMMSHKATRGFILAGTGVMSLTKSVKNLGSALKALFFITLRFASIALPLILATTAIQLAVNKVQASAKARAEHLAVLRDETEQLKNQTSAYNELVEAGKMDKYASLTSMNPDDLSITQRQELNDLQKELVDLTPSVIKSYDEEGKAVYRTREELEKLAEAREKELKAKELETALAEVDGFDFKEAKTAMKEYNKAVDELNHEGAYTEKGLNIMEKFFNDNMDSLKSGTPEMASAIREMQQELLVELGGIDALDFLNKDRLKILDKLESETMTGEEAKEVFQGLILGIQDSYSNLALNVEKGQRLVESKVEDLKPSIDIIAEAYASGMGIGTNTNEYKFITEQFADNFLAGLVGIEGGIKDWRKYIKDFGKEYEDLKVIIESNGINFASLYTSLGDGDTSVLDKMTKQLNDLKASSGGVTPEILQLEGAIRDLAKYYAEANKEVEETEKVFELSKQKVAELNQQYNDAISKIGFLNKTLEELNENHELGADTMGELTDKYPQLLDHMGDEVALSKAIKEALESEKNVAIQALYEKLEVNNEFLNKVKKANVDYFNELGRLYGEDVKNAKNLAQMKYEVEMELLKSLARGWEQYYTKQADGTIKMAESAKKLWGFDVAVTPESREMDRKIHEYNQAIKGVALDLKDMSFDVIKLTTNFDNIGLSKPKKEKEKKEDVANYQDEIEAWIRRNQLAQENISLNNQIIETQIGRAKDQEDLNKELELTNKLLSGQNKHMNELNATNGRIQQKINSERVANKKWDTVKWFDENAEATIAYVNLYNKASKATQEEMEKTFTRLQKLQKQYIANSDEVKNLGEAIYKTGQELSRLKFDSAERKIQNLSDTIEREVSRIEKLLNRVNRAFDLLEEGDDSQRISLLSGKGSVLQEKWTAINSNIAQLEKLKKSLAPYPQLLKDVNEQIDGWRENLRELEHEIIMNKNEIRTVYKDLAENVIKHYIEAIERERDAKLKAIDDDVKAEEERHKSRMEHLKEEMSLFEKYINQQIEAIDKQQDNDDFNENLSKRQKEARKVRDLINAYQFDNTLSGVAKKKELEEELAQIEEDIAKMKNDREIDLRKDALRDQLKDKQEHIDELQDEETKHSDKQKEQLDKNRKDLEKHYENVLADERRWNALRESVMSEHVDAINSELQKMVNEISAMSEEMGDNIAHNLITNLRETLDLLREISNDDYTPNWNSKEQNNNMIDKILKGEGGVKDHSLLGEADYKLMGAKFLVEKLKPHATTTGQVNGILSKSQDMAKLARDQGVILDPNNTSNYTALFAGMSDKEKLLTAKYIREHVTPTIDTPELRAEIMKMTDKIASEVRGRLGDVWADASFMEALKRYSLGFETGGYTGDFGGGKLAFLHEKEIVLNKLDTKNILDTVSIVRKLSEFFPKLNSFNVATPESSGGSGDTYVEIDFHIDRLEGGEDGANTLLSTLVDGMRRKGLKV